MDRQRIESSARELQIEIWQHRAALWPSTIPPLPRLFTPEIAAKVLNIEFEHAIELGKFGNGPDRFEVAGLIDRPRQKIAVSSRFKPEVQLFTGAHEIGHWQLHAHRPLMYRDRPLIGVALDHKRPREEREADYFAACFLAPKKVVVQEFEKRFGSFDQFRFDDNTAFGLSPSNAHSLVSCEKDSLEWEIAIASAIQYCGSPHFDALAETFNVSITTMAIRLRELGLGG